jgi:hypothetical protein
MIAIQIKLALLWVSLMLTYLLGDVLRIFSGDAAKMDSSLKNLGKMGWLGISILMVVPIIMIPLSILLPDNYIKIANIIISIFFFTFNLIGLPTYPSLYDKFLIVVGLIFNIIIIVIAWNWVVA